MGASPDMEFGFEVALRGPLATPDSLTAMARAADEMGFGFIGVSDRVIVPTSIGSRYPYSATGEFPGAASGESVELLTTLTFLAANTSKARVLTSIMVLPHRSPVLAAKMLATIDVLSKGRLIVGCGVGWMREEFEELDLPPYEERGAVADEYIRAFKELWTSDNPRFEGEYCRFSEIAFLPKPVQKPHPPIWIGGESPRALRRAARLGDAWYPIGNNPRFPVGTPQQYSEKLSRLRRYAEEAGRDPAEIDLAHCPGVYNDREAQRLPSGDRVAFTGAPARIADDIKAFARLGVRSFVLDFLGGTVEETLENMERFVTRVKPLAEV